MACLILPSRLRYFQAFALPDRSSVTPVENTHGYLFFRNEVPNLYAVHPGIAILARDYAQGSDSRLYPVGCAGRSECLPGPQGRPDRVRLHSGGGHFHGDPALFPHIEYPRKQHCANGGVGRRIAGGRRDLYAAGLADAAILAGVRLSGHDVDRAHRRRAWRVVHDPVAQSAHHRGPAALSGRRSHGRSAEGRFGRRRRRPVYRSCRCGGRCAETVPDGISPCGGLGGGRGAGRPGGLRIWHRTGRSPARRRVHRRVEHRHTGVWGRPDFLAVRHSHLYSVLASPEELAAITGEATGYEAALAVWSGRIRYLGVGAMAIGGVWALLSLVKPIKDGILSSLDAVRQARSGHRSEVLRTDRDTPIQYRPVGHPRHDRADFSQFPFHCGSGSARHHSRFVREYACARPGFLPRGRIRFCFRSRIYGRSCGIVE